MTSCQHRLHRNTISLALRDLKRLRGRGMLSLLLCNCLAQSTQRPGQGELDAWLDSGAYAATASCSSG